jgi:hypothetical protein
MLNAARCSKRDWYLNGGFANPKQFRKADSKGVWQYYYIVR